MYQLVINLKGKTHSEAKFEASELLGTPVEMGKPEDEIKIVEVKKCQK